MADEPRYYAWAMCDHAGAVHMWDTPIHGKEAHPLKAFWSKDVAYLNVREQDWNSGMPELFVVIWGGTERVSDPLTWEAAVMLARLG